MHAADARSGVGQRGGLGTVDWPAILFGDERHGTSAVARRRTRSRDPLYGRIRRPSPRANGPSSSPATDTAAAPDGTATVIISHLTYIIRGKIEG
jgi:hypothetical protein